MKYILAISLPLFILDQVTKGWILKKFPAEGMFEEIIPGFFNLVRVHNTGMAFGVGNGHPASNYIFVAIGLFALGVIIYLWRNNTYPGHLNKVALALLISGIFGNQADRLIPGRGYVVDFLDFTLPIYGSFPSFNVADSCICIAAGLLFIGAIHSWRQENAAAKSNQSSE